MKWGWIKESTGLDKEYDCYSTSEATIIESAAIVPNFIMFYQFIILYVDMFAPLHIIFASTEAKPDLLV